MEEIRLKAKYKAAKGMYGFKRSHNGNGKRVKKNGGFGNGYSDPYVKEDHVLVLKDGRRRTWIHKGQ